jgi:RNA polymerase sigma-32 factor
MATKHKGEADLGSDADAPAGDEAGLVDIQPGEAAPEPEPEIPTVVGKRARDPAAALTPLRDPVDRFLAEARRFQRLSEEEERALGIAVRDRGDMDAARKLVVHNLRLVVAIAYQYRRAWTNILDLFQEGSVGLMEAVKRWEPKLGPRFGTYAAYWIRAFILRFLLTNSRLIHVGNTRAGRKLFFRLEKERQKLLASGFEPTPKLLAAKLDVDEKDLDEVRQHLESREVPFEPRPGADGAEDTYSLAEKLAGGGRSPEAEAARAELADAVKRFTSAFTGSLTDEREVAVWREHLAADEPVPLGVLGERYGVTKQRMGQIADRLKKRFRDEILRELGPEIKTDWLGAQD